MRVKPWSVFRVALALSGLWLVGYVAYRYTLFNPPDHGTVYAYVLDASLVLAVVGMALAASPYLLHRAEGRSGLALRGALTLYGGIWMATGVGCVVSLTKGIAAAPLGGTVDMIHMLSDHIFLPLSVGILAWAPGWLARTLGAPEEEGDGVVLSESGLAVGEAGAGRTGRG